MRGASSGVSVGVAGLRKSYAERLVLRDLTFTVAAGEIVAIVGPSGAGKSTLLRCLNGIESIDAGNISFDGMADDAERRERRGRLSDRAASLRRARVGIVFQGFHLFSHLTVLENVIAAPLVVARLPRREAERRAHGLLDDFGLGAKAHDYPQALSGGEQQRVAIVRALAMQPRVALFDEPTSALDRGCSNWLGTYLRGRADAGLTMIVATHDSGFVTQIADRVLVLDAGRIVEEGSLDVIPAQAVVAPGARLFHAG